MMKNHMTIDEAILLIIDVIDGDAGVRDLSFVLTLLRELRAGTMPTLIPLSERLPDSEAHPSVIIHTADHCFAGEQFFQVKADSLNSCYYEDESDMPEQCRLATHWMPLPEVE